jgi:alkaline phosphatase
MNKSLHSATAALALSALTLAATSSFAAGEAKNVIFFLGDGMGPVTVTASRIFKYGEAGQLTMDTLGRTARIKTYSADAQTTDSAPSMAAYMTGVKPKIGMLSTRFRVKPSPVARATTPHWARALMFCWVASATTGVRSTRPPTPKAAPMAAIWWLSFKPRATPLPMT